jgi:hypothetical protein
MGTADTRRSLEQTIFDVQRRLSPVQCAAILGSIAILVWSVPGLMINPHFAIGDSATAVRVLGVDMNGWHAVSGLLVALPTLLVAARPYLAAVFVSIAAASLLATGVWALFDTRVAGGLFSFPNNQTDALLHFATSMIFLAGAAHYFLVERAPPANS